MVTLLDAHELLRDDREENEALLRGRVFTDFLTAWRKRVLEDVAARPFTEAELAEMRSPEGGDESAAEDAAVRAYGATLVAAAAVPGWLLLLQVGDGECGVVFMDRDSEAPLPDDGVAGVRTTSLALPNAAEVVRVAAVPVALDDVAAVWVCTDGFSGAQAEPGWRELVADQLREHLTTLGPREVAAKLPGWLGPAASTGGDDTSMGILLAGHLGPPDARMDVAKPLQPPSRPRPTRSSLWEDETDPVTLTLPADTADHDSATGPPSGR